MIDIREKWKCCGCYGCMNICPLQCINMKYDKEGFYYPNVDKDKCIDCGLCDKVCPVINNTTNRQFNTIAYACKNKNEKIRISSSSGGVFTNLCEYVINNSGIVFGAAFNENFEVEHMEATVLEECEKFRGSKYVQSKIGSTYKDAKKYLDSNKIVLFSGTQCQIKGLNLFLNKKYDNLICVDIICHGVPSPLVFDLYKKNLKEKYNSEIKYIRFRDKSIGWKEYSYLTKFENDEMYSNTLRTDIYMQGFLTNLYLRPSCYSCKSKNFTNNSDISLGDYWGIENKYPEFDDDKGVSLILVNSQNGQRIFNKIKNNIDYINADLEHAILNNSCIIKSVSYNKNREKFFKQLNNTNLEKLIYKNTTPKIFTKIKNKIQYELSRL